MRLSSIPLGRGLCRRRGEAFVVAALTGSTLVILPGAPASADALVVRDADDDAVRQSSSTFATGDFGTDLRSVRFEHRATAVEAVAVLDPGVPVLGVLEIDVDGDGNRDFFLAGTALAVDPGPVPGAPLNTVPCAGASTSEISGAARSLRFTVPRRCLDFPAAVSMRVGIISSSSDPETGANTVVTDVAPDARADGAPVFTRALPVATVKATTAPPEPVVSVRPSATSQRSGGAPVRLTVRVSRRAGGAIVVREGSSVLARTTVRPGRAAVVRLPSRLTVGVHRLVVEFVPRAPRRFSSASATISIRVTR